MEQKQYNFQLTFQEAQIVCAGLKKLVMEVAEPIITKLEAQFKVQNDAEATKSEVTQESSKEQDTNTSKRIKKSA